MTQHTPGSRSTIPSATKDLLSWATVARVKRWAVSQRGSSTSFEAPTSASLTHGTHATTLRGQAARPFLDDLACDDEQLLMAKVTGNYKRGKERTAKQHPRRR